MSEAAQVTATPTTQAPTQDAPKVETPKEELISPKFAALAKKEKAIFAEKRALQARQMELDRQRQEWEMERSKYAERERMWEKEPLKALEQYGHSYQTLTESVLSNGEPTAAQLQRRLDQIEKQREDERQASIKAQEEALTQQEVKVITDYKQDISAFVNANKSKYALTSLFDADADLIYETLDTYYEQTGRVMTHEEVADITEKYFDNVLRSAVKNRYPQAYEYLDGKPKPKEEKIEDGFRQKSSPRTLSNDMHTPVAASVLSAKTENERIARAMRALEGNR